MRIEELQLQAFGHFTNKTIDLSGGKQGLHIIYGRNESGKSSSLRALHQVLYGIPAKSTDNFKHAHPDMRIGIVLRHSDGSLLRLVRRKGNSKTLRRLDAENEIVNEADLQRYLGKINQSTFENMFGINHASLVSGGEAILNGSGELGQLLFTAGTGISDLRSVLAGLEKDYQDLYTRNGSTRSINKRLSEYAEAKRELRECELPNSEWDRHDLALKQAQKRKEQLDSRLSELEKQASRLRRYRDSIPLIAERSLYDEQIVALKEVVMLPETFEEDARRLLEQAVVLRREDEQDSKRLLSLNDELSKINIPAALIEKSAAIEILQQKLGSHQKAAQDRLSLDQALIEERERARACLRDLGRKDDFAAASNLRMSVQEKTRLRKLALERRALWQGYSDAQALRQRTEQRLRQCSEEMGKLAQVPACEKLLVCYKRIQQDPQMEERIIADANKLERQLKQIYLDLRKLQWTDTTEPGSLENATELHAKVHEAVIPDAHIIDNFEKEMAQLNKEIDSINARTVDLSNEQREIQFRLNEHELKTAAPTEADLVETRRLRDRGWNLVLKSWKSKQDDSAELAEYFANTNNSVELGTAYEWAMNRSDTLADRLRHEADHVALKIQLTAQVQKLTANLIDLAGKLKQRDSQREELRERWRVLWSPVTERQLNTAGARVWVSHFENIRAMLSTLLEVIEASKFNRVMVERAKTELKEALHQAAWPVAAGDSLLLNLIEQAQQCLDKYRTLKQQQSDLEKELSKLQIDLSNNATTEQTRKSEIDLWANSWQPAVEGLGLGATTSPEELTAFLDRLEQFFSHYDQISNFQRRIAGIDRDAEQFHIDVQETVSKAATHLNKLPDEEAAIELLSALKKAKELAQRKSLLNESLEELSERSESRTVVLQKINDKLAQMMAEASVVAETELLDASKKSVQRVRLAGVIDGYNRQIIRLAEGVPLDVFVVECKSHNLEVLDENIFAIEEERKLAEIERDNLQVSIGSEKQIIQSMDGSSKAADAAGQLQQILAELGQDVEQYCRLRIASVVLRKAIDFYREKNQSPILRTASELFSRLSNGSFAGLQEDFNEKGEPVLFGVRSENSALITMDGMSEGTCDQVYLALRIAGLCLYLEKEEALPFIVDDILVNFDDQRSLATLRVLAELSQRTQIILFTHHAHIVELAQEHLDPSKLFVTALNDADFPALKTNAPAFASI